MTQITPVVLWGGTGTRMPPVSRKGCPKGFVPPIRDSNVLQLPLEALDLPGPRLVSFDAESNRLQTAYTQELTQRQRLTAIRHGIWPLVALSGAWTAIGKSVPRGYFR